MRLRRPETTHSHIVYKVPSSSRKTVVTSALKGVQICPYIRDVSLQYSQLLSGYGGVKLTTRRRSSQVIWSIGGRRSDVGHPKAFLTGHMEHWWSPERHGPPEGVPHRPLWNIGGRRSDKLASKI